MDHSLKAKTAHTAWQLWKGPQGKILITDLTLETLGLNLAALQEWEVGVKVSLCLSEQKAPACGDCSLVPCSSLAHLQGRTTSGTILDQSSLTILPGSRASCLTGCYLPSEGYINWEGKIQY